MSHCSTASSKIFIWIAMLTKQLYRNQRYIGKTYFIFSMLENALAPFRSYTDNTCKDYSSQHLLWRTSRQMIVQCLVYERNERYPAERYRGGPKERERVSWSKDVCGGGVFWPNCQEKFLPYKEMGFSFITCRKNPHWSPKTCKNFMYRVSVKKVSVCFFLKVAVHILTRGRVSEFVCGVCHLRDSNVCVH